MNCKICENEALIALKHSVPSSYEAEIAHCPVCDFLFITVPVWLSEAYAEPINTTDTGYVTRNIYLSRKTLILFFLLFGKKNTFVDYAAGYGVLVRLMRDYGLNFLWSDPYTENLFSKGFEFNASDHNKISAVTCFECFEHLANPIEDIDNMLSISDTLLFSTRLKDIDVIPEADWSYYGWNHGQHVSFYSEKSLQKLADIYNLNFYTDHANLHIFTKKKLPKHILKFADILAKMQTDVILRKYLGSLTEADQKMLIRKGM